MRRLVPGGITGRLIVYLALIGVLPPLAVGIVSYYVSQSTVRTQALSSTERLLQAQSDYLEAQVEQIQELIGNILGVEAITEVVGRRDSEHDVYSQLATQARIGYLLNAYMAVRGLVSIDIFTTDGRHYHVGDTLDVQSIDEAHRDALLAAASKEPDATLWVGAETNLNGKSRVPNVIATARAIQTFEPQKGNRVAGLLLVSQDADYFHSAFRRLEGDMLGGLLLLDGRGRVIYHRDARLIGTELPPSASAALMGVRGSAQRVIGLVPLQELDARSSPIWRTTTMAIGGCLLVIALTTLSFSRAVVMPLRRIRQGFQELQRDGAASVRPLPILGRDEVGELTAWFNAFLESWGARERSEAALRDAETRFRMMHEASFTGLCVHHEGVLLEANQALCREFGRDHADLIGTHLADLFSPDTSTATLAVLACRETHGLDVEAVRADGTRFPAELSSRAMPFRGLAAYVVDIRNIEARKRAEAELERLKDEAEVASRAKSQFLATMSHEIRTPMNAVMGLAFLLQKRGLGAVEQEMVRKIRNAGQLLLGIINNILDFSKIEAGRLEIACEPFALCDVLDNVASIMAAAAGAKEIELIIGPVPAEAMLVRGDALRLE
ncbi:MAG: PAS domain S-box protein, partial [Alphaproteobacteria bacterium]